MIAWFLLDFILLGVAALVVLRIKDKWQRRTLYASGAFNVVCTVLTISYLAALSIDIGDFAANVAIVIAVFVLGTLILFGLMKLGKYAASTAKLYSQVQTHKRSAAYASTARTYASNARVYVPFQKG
jgi:hypothetical protein